MNPTPENPDPVNVSDLHDRFLDRALAEVVGAETPPDLSAHILKSRQLASKATLLSSARQSRFPWLSLAIAATLLIGVTLLLLPSVQSAREHARSSAKGSKMRRISDSSAQQEWAEVTAALPDSARAGELVVSDPKAGRANEPATRQWKMLSSADGLQQSEPEVRFAPAPSLGLSGLISDAHGRRIYGGGYGEGGRAKVAASKSFGYGRELSRRGEQGSANNFGTNQGTGPDFSGDQYTRIYENPFIRAEGGAAVSTFSIDVDTASYANVRQFLMQMNTLPPADAVRIEELINYFDYSYAAPQMVAGKEGEVESEKGGEEDEAIAAPFATHLEVAGCPWKPEHRLVRIGIKGRELDANKRPLSNLVFVVDVSGSMNEPNKLPLVVYGLQQLARELGENDRVAIVVYAASEGLVLPSTPGSEQQTILSALESLQAGGSTAGGAGIQLAYQIAEDHFIQGGTNRVILCTDGDFNVGVTSTAELERLCEQKAKDTGVFLSVLGFGRGNLNDAMMEAISNRGNGNYSYIDGRNEARRVLIEEMAGTLVTIAKDVKIQVEFNPRQVAGYRLIGYENRMLRTEDFNDDAKDAGEIGAGHTVTALYEVVPAGQPVDVAPVDGLKYQPSAEAPPANEEVGENAAAAGAAKELLTFKELLTLKMRYKEPEGDQSRKLDWSIADGGKSFGQADDDFQFAAAVAGFGLLLRNSEFKGNLTYEALLEIAAGTKGDDRDGYRAEFIEMLERARELSK